MGISLQADCSYGPKICHRFSYYYNFYTRLRKFISNFGFATMELKYTTFWSHEQQPRVSCSPVSLFSHYHIYIVEYLSLAETISLKILERPLSWHAKCSLRVSAVGGSRTSLALALC